MTSPTRLVDPDDVTVLDGGSALAALNRTEIDVQIATAKRYPRSIAAFKQQALEWATLDAETAGSMFYVLPRDGRKIEGPSVRLAEVAGSCWGNLRYGARVVEVGDRFLTAQGMAFDLERNLAAAVEVKRRIVNRHGERYTDDMITVTSNAACSIALRAAIFKVIPFAFIKSVYEAAKLTAIGKALTMEERRTRAVEWFAKIGCAPAQMLQLVGRKALEDVTVDDLVTLSGIRTAIQDGDTTLEEVLREQATAAAEKGERKPGLDGLADRLEGKAAQTQDPGAQPSASARPGKRERGAAAAKPVEATKAEPAGTAEGTPAGAAAAAAAGATNELPLATTNVFERIKATTSATEIEALAEQLFAPASWFQGLPTASKKLIETAVTKQRTALASR